ncbi:hypothetical protein [Arthrobacter subterraneus]|uniref:hypothetical protein n=1 Tax=Arthrobacter subterraneus TaxID=335973 RepID=UPI0011140194|nr:hypothetical protein [Arthrobacter subterraneus]
MFVHLISDEARLSLISAGEHLRLAWTAVKAGELYPTAHFTTLRGALLASAQAVYILGPDEPGVRRERGLTVIVEAYKRLRQFHLECLNMPDLSDDDRRKTHEQMVWLDGRRATAIKAGGQPRGPNISDDVIPYAANFVFVGEPDKQNSVMLLWRQMSGDAHALTWSMTLRATLGPTQKGEPLTAGTAAGSLEAIAEPFVASFRLLKRGWSLFDQRCEASEGR